MDATDDEAVIAARVSALLGGRSPVLVCLDGRSGSGKTTLARRLSRRLRDAGTTVTVLHLDHVYPGWDGLAEASRLVGEDVLTALREGTEPTYPSWSWVRDRPGPLVRVRQADVVLVEGVGCGSLACRRSADLLVWLEAPPQVRHARAMARDGDSYAPHWQRWAAQEDAYVAHEAPAQAADLVVTTAPPGPTTSGAGPTGTSPEGPSLEP